MKRLAIIVPYRDRRQHLDQFVPHMRAYFARDKLDKDIDYRVLIVDLIYEGGIANMNYSISNTAEYGEYVSGPRIITPDTRAEMKRILADIQSGKFTRDWMLENKVNQTSFKATRAKLAEHPIEQVGAKLRAMMPWIKQRALVDKSRN